MLGNYQEIFRTEKGCVYQSDLTRQYLIEFGSTYSTFGVSAFLNLKKIIDRIDLERMIESTDDADDVAIISPPQASSTYVLTICEVYHLKELLNGARVMLELNSILHERLYSVCV